MTITQILSNEHLHCDTLFVQVEVEVTDEHWDKANTSLADFIKAMEQHFSAEEHVLFPAFEQHTGHPTGPTQVMRFEHQQMRQLFEQMQNSVTQQNQAEYLGLSETLLMLMRQHNAKEEQILYPMTDQVLSDKVPTILEQMRLSQPGA